MSGEEFGGKELVALVRAVANDSASADPAVIAATVLDKIPASQRKAALSVCLPNWTRVALGDLGRQTRQQAKSTRMTTPDRIRSWHAQQLGVSLFCGSEWKFLRDCTAEDLHSAAADRYRKATEVTAEADRWTKVALFMEENDRTTAAQISEAELKSLMESA